MNLLSHFKTWRDLPLPNLPTLLLAAVGILCYAMPFTDLDFTWHIRTGQQILETGQLRTTDTFSYTIADQPVHDFEWFYEVVLFVVWQIGGFPGLSLLKTILVLSPLLVLLGHLRRLGVQKVGILLALLAAVLLLQPMWNLRPLWCTTLGLVLVASTLQSHCLRIKPLPWWLPMVLLLWGNMHPGVLAGQVLILSAIAWEGFNQRWRFNPPLSGGEFRRLALIGGLSLLASMVAPDPIHRLLYPFQPELRHPIMRIFTEMQPLTSFWNQTPLLVFGTYGLAGLVIWSVVMNFRHWRGWEIALLLASGLLATMAIRGLPDFVFLLLTLGVPHLVMVVTPRQTDSSLGIHRPAFLQIGWLAVFLFLGFPFVEWNKPKRDFPLSPTCACPVEVVDFIEAKGLGGRFFAPPNFGAYLGWRLKDSVQVYTDTRGFFFPPQLLEDSHLLLQLTPGWETRLQRVVEEYSTDYFLLETTGPRGALWNKLKSEGVKAECERKDAALIKASEIRLLMQIQ